MTFPLPQPVFDANASTGGFGDLPDWDLSDLYPAPDAPEFARDMAQLEKDCAAFAAPCVRSVVNGLVVVNFGVSKRMAITPIKMPVCAITRTPPMPGASN